MHSRRKFIKNTGIFSAGLLALQTDIFALPSDTFNFALKDFISKRPPLAERKFTSEAVEKAIVRIKKQIVSPTLKTEIERAIGRQAALHGRTIFVNVDESRVVLSGAVQSWRERMDAEHAAWPAPGVTDVDNRLEVRERD